MQFNVIALVAAMAAVASAQSTVYVTVCESSAVATPAPSAGMPAPSAGSPAPSGTGVVGSTGVTSPPAPTGSPIFTGAASVNGASALGMIVAGAFALLI